MAYLNMGTVHIGLEVQRDEDQPKVKEFFQKLGFTMSSRPIDKEFDTQFPVPVIITNIDEPIDEFYPISIINVFVSFHPCSTSKDIVHKFKDKLSRSLPQYSRNKFDEILVLFIGIKDDEQNTATNLEIERELQKPNLKFVEWSVNASEQETRKIFQELVCMGYTMEYIDNLARLKHQHGNIEDIPQFFNENITDRSWSMNPHSTLYVDMFRLFQLYMVSFTSLLRTITKDDLQPWIFGIMQTGDQLNCYSFDVSEVNTFSDVLSSATNHPFSSIICKLDCDRIHEVFMKKTKPVFVRSLVIDHCEGQLNLKFLSSLKSLEHLVIRSTLIDVTNLMFPTHLRETIKHLVIRGCGLTEVPMAVESLTSLEVLIISDNPISILPGFLSNLRELRTFLYEHCPIEFPPKNVLKRSFQDVIKYLGIFQHDGENVPFNEAKLIVVGQEGVGKSTLIKGMRCDYWVKDIKPPDKTDGVDITILRLEETRFLVYDLAGDVEYLNTHSLFLSSQCLHLAVFDMSQLFAGKGTRSADQLCRLELWLQMIAAQHPNSYVIIVGTHADHPRITTEIVSIIRKQIVQMMKRYQNNHKKVFDNCILCNVGLLPVELKEIVETVAPLNLVSTSGSCIPHVLGYFEVSSITKYPRAPLSMANKNLETLKSAIASSNSLITAYREFRIPKTFQSFYQRLDTMKVKTTMSLSEIYDQADECGVPSDTVESMLRFFHSQGNLLWYEDIPEMREVIITDPHWLSCQLRTLISYRSDVDAVCDGILHLPSLSTVWADMTEENRQKLLILFRSVGLCFSISSDKELFPCNLPIGWPDREKWPLLPTKDESQTSFLFTFSFLPPTFSSRLIVEVNKKRGSFLSNVHPVYYRFHILYVTKENERCDIHTSEVEEQDSSSESLDHTVHYEIMPHNNSIKVSIRGPSPCCIVPGILSTIEDIQSCYYPGITFQTQLLCPVCEMKKVPDPSTFLMTCSNHGGRCTGIWHKVGSINDILRGKYSPTSNDDTRRIVGEILKDLNCPKLFVVLPINTNCLSLKDRIVYTYLKDGYALHLLCECPDQWHFVDSPGFRIGKPKEFLEKYGKHLCAVLKAIGKAGAPLRAAAALDPSCKAGAAVAAGANSIANELQGFLDNVFDKYPHLKPASGSNNQDLENLQASKGLQRSELAKFLEVVAKGREFGPLVFTYVDKRREWLWLCEDHRIRFTIIEKN